MFPLFLKLTGRLGVVVGGGPVGQRKARALLEGGAAVRLVCLEARPEQDTHPALDWLTQPYRPDHLDGASLVCAAATPEVNRLVVADAHDRGLWVNAATDPESGDFFMPASLRRGNLVIAVATEGQAPGVAREVRLLLETQLDEAFGQWLTLLAELRPLVWTVIADPQRRRTVLQRLCRSEWLEGLRRDGLEQVRAAMLRAVEAEMDQADT